MVQNEPGQIVWWEMKPVSFWKTVLPIEGLSPRKGLDFYILKSLLPLLGLICILYLKYKNQPQQNSLFQISFSVGVLFPRKIHSSKNSNYTGNHPHGKFGLRGLPHSLVPESCTCRISYKWKVNTLPKHPTLRALPAIAHDMQVHSSFLPCKATCSHLPTAGSSGTRPTLRQNLL